MFKSTPKKPPSYKDFTKSLGESSFYKCGQVFSGELGMAGEVTALGVDPVGGWLAAGTSCGSIHLLGSPAISLVLSVYKNPPKPLNQGNVPVKFICFHPGFSRLVAIDGGNVVHVWDLGCIDPRTKLPHKDATNSLFGTVTAIDLPSPSTSHLLVTLKDGTTLFLDLARKCNLSPYRIPNVWSLHEERLRRSGMHVKRRSIGPPMATAIQVCPRDLNLVLVGYEGGVIVWNIQNAATERTYEFIIPPGAPGGGTYMDSDLFTERSPSVTCVCWRPDGLVFAVGYDDGCIAVWALEDSDKPLSVRTVALEDVNVTDAESLFESGALGPRKDMDLPGDGNGLAYPMGREPIFKLLWASFPDAAALKASIAAAGADAAGEPVTVETRDYGERGETVMVVLGGLLASDQTGITCLQFPTFKPPTANIKPPTSPGGQSTMSSAVRSAFRDSLGITGSTLYPTTTPCEDFFLLPRTNPHFSLSFDPIAIITLLGLDRSLPRVNGPTSSRAVKAHTFPPVRSDEAPLSPGRKEFRSPGNEEAFVPMSAAPFARSSLLPTGTPRSPASPWSFAFAPSPTSPLPSSMNQPHMGRDGFGSYRLPFWTGEDAVLGCEIITPPMGSFRRAIYWSIEQGEERVPRLPLRGGAAYPDLETHGAPDLRSVKLEHHRLLVTWHAGGTVQFFDFSPHLLVLPPTGLRFEYPAPLPYLTVDIRDLLRDESLSHLPVAKLLATNPSQIEIQSVHVASDTLELAVVLVSGQVIYYKFGEAKPGYEAEEDRFRFTQQQEDRPAEEITSLGHLARWKLDGFKPVFLLDVRRGRVAACAVSDAGFLAVSFAQKSLCVLDLRGPDVMLREGFAEDGGKSKGGEASVAESLTWSICAIGTDPTVGLRLFVNYQQGLSKIYTFNNGLAGWEVAKKAVTFSHDSLMNPLASFIVDWETGDELVPNAERLQAAMIASDVLKRSQQGPATTTESHSIWISSSRRTIRSQININGERLGKVELDEDLRAVFLVNRHTNKVIIALAESGTAYAYSVPALDLVLRLPLQYPLGKISMDTSSGDYIEQLSPGSPLHTLTLFDHRKALPPNVILTTLNRPIPFQPLPMQSSILASWLGTWGGGALVGNQVDVIIAGPNRPPVVAKPIFPPPRSHIVAVERPPLVSRATPTKKPRIPISDARARKDAYTEMQEAAEERGNMLDGLSETLGRMTTKAGEMATQAQRVAAKETAKATAKSFFRFG